MLNTSSQGVFVVRVRAVFVDWFASVVVINPQQI